MTLKDNILTSWLTRISSKRMPALGPRELDVLDQLWNNAALSAQQLHEKLAADLSLNTIQSTLERLHRKGLVKRAKKGRAFIYSASLSRSDIVSRVLNDLARDVGRGDLAPIISGFAEFMAAEDPKLDSRLRRVLEADEEAPERPERLSDKPEQHRG